MGLCRPQLTANHGRGSFLSISGPFVRMIMRLFACREQIWWCCAKDCFPVDAITVLADLWQGAAANDLVFLSLEWRNGV